MLCPVLVPTIQKGTDRLKRVSRRSVKIIKGLKNFPCEGTLKESFHPGEEGDLITVL